MLTELFDTGRLELLRAIKDRNLTINEVFSAQRTGRMGFLATDVVLQRPLWDALDAWLPTSGRAPETRRRADISVRTLRRANVLGSGALVRDLATVNWKAVYNTWPTGEALRPAYVLLAATGSRDGEWAMPGKPRGAGRNRTVGWRFCRPLPYHLATAPESGKADQPVGVLQEPRYYSCFFSFNTIATCPSVGPYRLAVSFWLRKRIS